MTVSCDSIEVFNISSTGYAIRVKGLRSGNGISGLQVPTWSEESGQDDLVWYDALKWGDDWYCTINSVDHNSDSGGTYQSHFYVVTPNGSKEYLDGKKINVPERPVGLAKAAMPFIGGLASLIGVGISLTEQPQAVERFTTHTVREVTRSCTVKSSKR